MIFICTTEEWSIADAVPIDGAVCQRHTFSADRSGSQTNDADGKSGRLYGWLLNYSVYQCADRIIFSAINKPCLNPQPYLSSGGNIYPALLSSPLTSLS